MRLVALSRLVRVRDEEMLDAAARSPVGEAVLAALRSVTLRVAISTGAADQGLADVQISTLFNLSASHVATQRLYDGGLSLPTKLPWQNAKALIAALFDALAALRQTTEGYAFAQLLLRLPVAPLDDDAQAALSAAIAVVEPDLTRRVTSGSNASSSSDRSTPPPLPLPLPPPPPPPQPPLPVVVPAVPVAPDEPFALLPTASLIANAEMLVAMCLRHDGLDAVERAVLLTGLDDGLSVLQAGGADARSALLTSNVLVALAVPAGALLWACVAEAAEGQPASVATMAAAIERCCSTMAGALFASQLLS